MTFKHFTFGSSSPDDLISETQNTETKDNFDTITQLLLSSYFPLDLDRHITWCLQVSAVSSLQLCQTPVMTVQSRPGTIAIVLIVINDKSVEH